MGGQKMKPKARSLAIQEIFETAKGKRGGKCFGGGGGGGGLLVKKTLEEEDNGDRKTSVEATSFRNRWSKGEAPNSLGDWDKETPLQQQGLAIEGKKKSRNLFKRT